MIGFGMRTVAALLALAAVTVDALFNPILPGFNPDPAFLRVGSDYFIATSTFEVFPGHPIYHSTNLVDWELVGHALNRPAQLSLLGTPGNGGLWAPGLRYHDGIFYLISTSRHVYTSELSLFPRSFYVTTDDIFSNNWSDPIYFDSLGYDPDLFWDDNGDVYSTWCGINDPIDKIYGIYQNTIDIATGDSLTPAQLIFSGTLPNNSSARPEGPKLYNFNGTYYLLIAEGGTGATHRATIQRGPSPSGPWENNPKNPLVYNGEDPSLAVQSTGHADILQAEDGSFWGTLLGTRPQGGNTNHAQLGRETFLYPVTWEDGWPIFNGGRPITEHLVDVLEDRPPVTDFELDFGDVEGEDLEGAWYFVRTPYKKFYSLTERKGYLRVKGNAYAIGDRDSAALVLRKQTAYNQTFETTLEFSPLSNTTEAGITIWRQDSMHDEIGISGDADGSGKRYIVTRKLEKNDQVGPWALTPANNTKATVDRVELETDDEPVKLRIVGSSTSYTFGYAEGEGEWVDVLSIDSALLSLFSDFKGTLFGMYNTGRGFPTLAPADFRYWKQYS
ncbi:glycoside hydrolase family 43 protein [Cylindrobasidium torrendii FP15055 ss-10]|uniref:Glycoside hydrolase family 43 protein n=1 Tax=Cylindrobasidium torrendii FP15055 ss-10 TaxID=1314674 RepID=A0A0D7BLJ9_9AGAR|nr:glycoside hydrolase family 43 protein [Cylindrobasidium torrendii FP15055 ss-10]